MKKATLVLTLVALLFAAGSAAAVERRTITESFDYLAGQRLILEFPVGALRVEGHDGAKVVVEVEAECRWSQSGCADRLQKIEIRSRSSDRRLLVEVESDGPFRRGKLELEAWIRVPRQAAIEIEMSVGALEVADVAGDLRVELGVGELTLWLSEAAVGSVVLDAGIGEVSLHGAPERVQERRSLLIGGKLRWDEGVGQTRVEADVGVGEISAYLD